MKKVKSFKDYFKLKRKDRSFKKVPVFKDSIEATRRGYLPGEKFYKEYSYSLMGSVHKGDKGGWICEQKEVKHHTPCTVAPHPIKGCMGNGALTKEQILAATSYYKLMGKDWLTQEEEDVDADDIGPPEGYVRWRIYGGTGNIEK